MRFFTSQRPGLWISIVSCFFRVFFCVPFSWFFLVFFVFFSYCFPLLFHYCGCCFLFRLLFSSGCHALSDVLPHFSNPGFSLLRLNMSAKYSCKNTEYDTFDFGSSGPTGPQRRREKTTTKKIRKNNTKKLRKKTGPRASLKKNKKWKIKKHLQFFCVFLRFFCVFLAFFFAFFLHFFLRFFCVLFVFFFCVFFCVLFVVLFSSSQGPLFLCEASLATQIFDVISCGPGKLDLSRSMLKKGATQLFPISDPYPAGTRR